MKSTYTGVRNSTFLLLAVTLNLHAADQSTDTSHSVNDGSFGFLEAGGTPRSRLGIENGMLLCSNRAFLNVVQDIYQRSKASSQGANPLKAFEQPGPMSDVIGAFSSAMQLGYVATLGEKVGINGNYMTVKLSQPRFTMKFAVEGNSLSLRSVVDDVAGKESLCPTETPVAKVSSLSQHGLDLVQATLKMEDDLRADYEAKNKVWERIVEKKNLIPSIFNLKRRKERLRLKGEVAELMKEVKKLEGDIDGKWKRLNGFNDDARLEIDRRLNEIKSASGSVAQLTADRKTARDQHAKVSGLTDSIDALVKNGRKVATDFERKAREFNEEQEKIAKEMAAINLQDQAVAKKETDWIQWGKNQETRDILGLSSDIENQKNTIAAVNERLSGPRGELKKLETQVSLVRDTLERRKNDMVNERLARIGEDPKKPSKATQEEAKLEMLNALGEDGGNSNFDGYENWKRDQLSDSHWGGVENVDSSRAKSINAEYHKKVLEPIETKITENSRRRAAVRAEVDRIIKQQMNSETAPFAGKETALKERMKPDLSLIELTQKAMKEKETRLAQRKEFLANFDQNLVKEKKDIQVKQLSLIERRKTNASDWHSAVTKAETQRAYLPGSAARLHERVKTELTGMPGSQRVVAAPQGSFDWAKNTLQFSNFSNLSNNTSPAFAAERVTQARNFAQSVENLLSLSAAEGKSVEREVESPLSTEIARISQVLENFDDQQRRVLFDTLPSETQMKLRASGLKALKEKLGI